MENKNYMTFPWVIIGAISKLPALITERTVGFCQALNKSLSQNRNMTMIQEVRELLIIIKYQGPESKVSTFISKEKNILTNDLRK